MHPGSQFKYLILKRNHGHHGHLAGALPGALDFMINNVFFMKYGVLFLCRVLIIKAHAVYIVKIKAFSGDFFKWVVCSQNVVNFSPRG